MQLRPGLVLLTVLGACGGGGVGGGDDDSTPDAGTIDPPARGFQLQSPEIKIDPGQEITYCWYFRTPNTEMLSVKRWTSHMTPGSHHMILFTTNSDLMPVGTVSAVDCGGLRGSATNLPVWTYAAQTVDADLVLPSDDGAGQPLGQEVAANQAGYLQMHYLNATDQPIMVRVTLNAEAHEASVAYTRTAAYVTFNGSISIPPNATGDVETQQCPTPAGAKFWLMSTHAHKQAVNTTVKDGDAMVFTSNDWAHPGTREFANPTFYSFASGKLTYQCTYDNTGDNYYRTVTTGDSAATDEMCMASGYYFPATGPKFCFNSFILN